MAQNPQELRGKDGATVNMAKSMPEVFIGAIRAPQKELAKIARKWREERGQTDARSMGETLCWSCENAVGGKCPWSRNFTPVVGWDAEETLVHAGDVLLRSYCVRGCPLFTPDRTDFFTEPKGCPMCGKRPCVVHTGEWWRVRHCTGTCGWRYQTAYKKSREEVIALWNRGEIRSAEYKRGSKK